MNDLVSVKTSCIFLLIRGRVIKTKQNFWWNEKFLRVEKPTSGGSEGLIGLKWINELWWKHILDCSVPLKGWPSTPHETIESAAQNSTRFWKNVFDCWYRTHSICCQSKKKKKAFRGRGLTHVGDGSMPPTTIVKILEYSPEVCFGFCLQTYEGR